MGEALKTLLSTYDINVQLFPNGKSFLETGPLDELGSHCGMIETFLPDMSGLSLLRRIRSCGSQLPIIILSGKTDHEMRRQALKFGATDVIDKSLINTFLVERLSQLFPHHHIPRGPVDLASN